MRPVAARDPETFVVDDGRGDLLVAVRLVDAAPELQQRVEELPAARQPVGHAGCRFVEHEEVELRPDLLVVALLRVLDEGEMRLELLLRRESVGVDARELVALLVAAPVGAGHGAELPGGRQQRGGVLDVRAAAEIDEVPARAVDRQDLVVGQVLDELDLELLIVEERERVLLGNLLARPIFLALQDLLHLLLDRLEVVVRRRTRQQEVVVEAVGDLRPDGILRFLAENLDDGLCEHMRQRMAVDVQELFFIHDVSPLLDSRAGARHAGSKPRGRRAFFIL